MRRDQRSWRSTNNFIPERASVLDTEVFEKPFDAKPLDEEEEELMAALGTFNPPRRNYS